MLSGGAVLVETVFSLGGHRPVCGAFGPGVRLSRDPGGVLVITAKSLLATSCSISLHALIDPRVPFDLRSPPAPARPAPTGCSASVWHRDRGHGPWLSIGPHNRPYDPMLTTPLGVAVPPPGLTEIPVCLGADRRQTLPHPPHWFGTDASGYDVFLARDRRAPGTDLMIALLANGLSTRSGGCFWAWSRGISAIRAPNS